MTDKTITLNKDEFAGLQIAVIEIRDNARLQRRTGLSYLDCIALKNKFNAING